MTTATKERTVVLKAIDDLGRRVTAADVASKTGLPLLKINNELNQIASDTQGHMEVGSGGELAYRFSAGFQSAYLAKGIQRVLQRIGSVAFSVGFFLLRISFGIMLIVSLLAIAFLIFVLIMYGRGSSGDRDRGGGFNFRFSFFDYLILRDILFWATYGSYTEPDRRGSRIDRPTIQKPSKSNFFFNCFTFLFGDGNPNLNLEDRKWSMIADVIRQHDGVATAEQLAPYTGADPKNEDGVLPVLVRFDGRPEVTENGDIIYLFPSMQVTAKERHFANLPTFLNEWSWKFHNLPSGEMMPVYILAGVNFFGSWFLFLHLMAVKDIDILWAFAPLIYMLVVYGTLFVLVPAIRAGALVLINAKIELRNNARAAYARLLEQPTDALLKKLASARKMKLDTKVISSKDAIFTTEKDSLEQEFDD